MARITPGHFFAVLIYFPKIAIFSLIQIGYFHKSLVLDRAANGT